MAKETTDQKKDVQYVRQQKGHSIIFALLIAGPFTGFILPIYWWKSPNHFFHL